MQSSNKENIGSNTQLPRVALLVIGQQNINQVYDGVLDIVRLPVNKQFAKTFNDYQRNLKEYDLYGFVLPMQFFLFNNIINGVVHKLTEYQEFIGWYSDVARQIVLSPLFSKRKVIFNEKFNIFFGIDVIKTGAGKLLWYHEATPLFGIGSIDKTDYNNDIQMLEHA